MRRPAETRSRFPETKTQSRLAHRTDAVVGMSQCAVPARQPAESNRRDDVPLAARAGPPVARRAAFTIGEYLRFGLLRGARAEFGQSPVVLTEQYSPWSVRFTGECTKSLRRPTLILDDEALRFLFP